MSATERVPVSVLERTLACLLVVPSVLHVVAAGGSGWLLVAAALVGARLVGGRDDARVWAAGAALGFALPLWPSIAGVLGFQLERVLVHGALACLLWRGVARPSAHGRLAAAARLVLAAWAAWSVGAALRGWRAALPEGAPWIGEQLARLATGMLVPSSLTEPTRALDVLFVRLESLALAWTGLEIGLRRVDLRRTFARFAAAALVLGFATAAVEMVRASWWRGESALARLAAGIGRMHRPLTDHNALGSALVLLLPAVAVLAWSALRPRRSGERRVVLGAFASMALALGGVLLVTSRSKSAIGAVAVAALVVVVVRMLAGTPRARRAARTSVLVGLVVVVGVNLLPRTALERISTLKYGEDALRLVHRAGVLSYLKANRVAIWEASGRMIADRPLAGVGYGRYPAELASYRDPELEGQFNPLHENAHNQWMQIAAEEGVGGLLLALAVVALALAGGVRAWRAPPDAGPARYGARDPDDGVPWLAWTAALVGLVVNLVPGHALLVPTVAHLFGAYLGVLLAGGACASEPAPGALAARSAARPRPGRLGLVSAAAFALALVPAPTDPRPPRAGFALGCQPWLDLGDERFGRARVLAPHARWIERWERDGPLSLLLVDVRPTAQFPEPQRATVRVNGVRAITDRELPRPAEIGPSRWLLVERPDDVAPGDLVELDVVIEPPFCGSLIFDSDFARIGARTVPIEFR